MTVIISLRNLCRTTDQLDSLRTICIHEAGHAAVARQYGLRAYWNVWPDLSDPDEPKWEGQTDIVGNAPISVYRQFALAGIVATELDYSPFVSADEIHDALEIGAIKLSKQDAELGRGYKLKDVRRCLRLVLHLMPRILEDASDFLAYLCKADKTAGPEWASTIEQLRHATQPGQPRYEQSRLSSPRDDRRVVGYI